MVGFILRPRPKQRQKSQKRTGLNVSDVYFTDWPGFSVMYVL